MQMVIRELKMQPEMHNPGSMNGMELLSKKLPVLLIVFGLPGSGKSFFALQLAHLLKAKYINSDIVRMGALVKRTYSENEKRIVYNNMMSKMLIFLRRNENVVLDATFYKDEIRSAFLNKAEGKAKILFIEVKADESLIRERLTKPRSDSEADFEVYKKIKKQWEPLQNDHLILHSTNNNVIDMLQKASTYYKQYDT